MANSASSQVLRRQLARPAIYGTDNTASIMAVVSPASVVMSGTDACAYTMVLPSVLPAAPAPTSGTVNSASTAVSSTTLQAVLLDASGTVNRALT